MYVPPRPRVEDDPLFAVRLASATVIGFVLGLTTGSPLPVLFPALLVGLMAGMRKRFDLKKAIGGPVIFLLLIPLLASIISLGLHQPAMLIVVMWFLFFLAFYIIVSTGNPIGSLIAIFSVLLSVLGMFSWDAMMILRDAIVSAACYALLVIPILYAVFPPATEDAHVDDPQPAYTDELAKRAAIRASVLLLFSVFLYTVLDTSDLIMAIAAVYVLCFPTREAQIVEAKERSYGTLLGGVATFGVLGLLSVNGHLFVLLGLSFLVALYFGHKMMTGPHQTAVYQFALSVTVSLVGGALTNQEPAYATISRVILTLLGAMVAAFLVSLLERRFIDDTDTAALTPRMAS